MRRKIYPVLFVAALSLSACTEVLEPNVDYGGNTFINDYSSLVEAVNNLNKALQERFTALNTLLEKNLAEIKVAIDENTGAIKVLDQNTKQGLKDINTSIFDGFKTLSDQVDAQGNAIVYAMNDNGQLLRLEIEKNGKLISTQILESSNALIKAINDQTKSLEERFAALDATIKAGLVEVTLGIDKNTGAITLMDKNTQSSLATIDGSLTKGFKALKKAVNEQGNAIVGAINEQGELLVAEIKSTGEVISTQIKGSVDDLIKTLEVNNKSLTEKIEALDLTVKTGLAEVKGSVNELTGMVELQTEEITKLDGTLASGMNDLKAGLENVNKSISEGFVAVSDSVSKSGERIVTAINDQGKKLKLAIDKNGRVISTSINAFNFVTNTQLAWLLVYQRLLTDKLAAINANLDKLTEAQKSNVETLKKILDSMNTQLGDKGIYNISDKLYMTQEAWNMVSSDKNSNLYNKAKVQARTVNVTLYIYVDDANHVSINRTPVTADDKDALYAVNYDTVSGIDANAKVYEIVKMKDGLVGYKFTLNGKKKDLIGLWKYNVGYSFNDVLGDHAKNASKDSQKFMVTYLSGSKLKESVKVSVTTK